MRGNERKRAYAERLFIEDGWTAKAIAETVGVSENTVGSWVKKYSWKETKDELFAAPHRLKKAILEEIQRVINGETAKFNSDTLSKLTTALERIDKKVSTQLSISVIKEYNNWLASQDVENDFLMQHLDSTKIYLQYRIENEQ